MDQAFPSLVDTERIRVGIPGVVRGAIAACLVTSADAILDSRGVDCSTTPNLFDIVKGGMICAGIGFALGVVWMRQIRRTPVLSSKGSQSPCTYKRDYATPRFSVLPESSQG